MPLDIQFKLKENPLYIKYLREHSYWYKLLIRNPNLINKYIEEVKTFYKLRPSDKINNTLETINIISNLFNNMI